MSKEVDAALMVLDTIILLLVQSVQVLLSIRTKGVFVDRKKILLKKTNKELKSMLNGFKKISQLNKNQLVEMVLLHTWLHIMET